MSFLAERPPHIHRFKTRDPDQTPWRLQLLQSGYDLFRSPHRQDSDPTDFHPLWWPAGPWGTPWRPDFCVVRIHKAARLTRRLSITGIVAIPAAIPPQRLSGIEAHRRIFTSLLRDTIKTFQQVRRREPEL